MVNEHVAFQMVEFVLHDACQVALYPFVVRLELFVKPFDMDAGGANHLLVDSGQRQAAFFAGVGMRLVFLDDMGIDEDTSESFVLGHVVAQHVEVYNHQTDGLANLRGRQSDTLTVGQCLPHVFNQLIECRVVCRNVFSHFA